MRKPWKAGGKIADGDGVFDEIDLVSRDRACVEGKAGGGKAGAKNELATGKSRRRGVARGNGHSS